MSVIEQLFFIQIVLFQKGNDRAEFELFGKNSRAQRQVDNIGFLPPVRWENILSSSVGLMNPGKHRFSR